MSDNANGIKKIWLIIKNNESVLINKDESFPNDIDIAPILPSFIKTFNLGVSLGVEYFCAEIDEKLIAPEGFITITLRQALSLLGIQKYAIMVKACSIINWDKNHQFCGCCGEKTTHHSKSFERTCSACNTSFYPRISPAVIVLIHNNDNVVMSRSPHFAPGIYGLIAGFVDAGETIEEAIHREVQEEVGLKIKNLSYFGSQPWPFPDSLMIAFFAEYDSGEIVIDNNEIEDANWYRFDNLPKRPASVSIASQLLDRFVHLCQEKHNKNDIK